MKDYKYFRNNVTDMEQRLGNICCKAFDECNNCESAFKVRKNKHILVHVHVYAHIL